MPRDVVVTMLLTQQLRERNDGFVEEPVTKGIVYKIRRRAANGYARDRAKWKARWSQGADDSPENGRTIISQ